MCCPQGYGTLRPCQCSLRARKRLLLLVALEGRVGAFVADATPIPWGAKFIVLEARGFRPYPFAVGTWMQIQNITMSIGNSFLVPERKKGP
jgi:hypothetical protein